MYGYHPTWHMSPAPAAATVSEDRSKVIEDIRKEVHASLEIAAERMKRYYDQTVQDVPEYKVGDRVWLEATNIRTTQPSKKLSHKRLGPYEITHKIGPLDYRLKLPPTMKIHPVFHTSLLHPHKEDRIPNRQQPPPPPVVVEGQEEWEVEEILDSRKQGRGLQYLVRWKGFPADTSWEPRSNITNAGDAIRAFHRRHPNRPQLLAKGIFDSLPWQPLENFTEPPPPKVVKTVRWAQGVTDPKHIRPSRTLGLKGGVMSRLRYWEDKISDILQDLRTLLDSKR
jgi:hypothetical protein